MEAYEDRANEAEKKSDIGLLEEINKDIQEISMEIDTLENKKDNPAITTYESAVNSYDISTNEKTAKYFPAIQSQGSVKGSCVSFSVCYYMFSYEANKLNDINSKILANCYSPEWGHVNFKNNQSSIYSGLKNMGCLKWNEFLYSDNGDLTLTEASEEEQKETMEESFWKKLTRQILKITIALFPILLLLLLLFWLMYRKTCKKDHSSVH